MFWHTCQLATCLHHVVATPIADYYLNPDSSSSSELKQGRKWLIKSANYGHENALRKVVRSLKEGNDGFEIDYYRSKKYSEALFERLEKKDVRPN